MTIETTTKLLQTLSLTLIHYRLVKLTLIFQTPSTLHSSAQHNLTWLVDTISPNGLGHGGIIAPPRKKVPPPLDMIRPTF